ncbi:MAG: very short patch repair endonuclease, partial [Burkholderiaceae bacterium]|nr:very short patch repair endonuclease [Burkholderiaceae bacterium]
DFVFRQRRVALFVDGCFWHSCPKHGSLPSSNVDFWQLKFSRNRARDRFVDAVLCHLGWTVLRVWEHELEQPEKLARWLVRHI